MSKKPRVVALEEHYWDAEVATHFDGAEARSPKLRAKLDDLGALRIKEMDEAGIDVQVISHGAPAMQRIDAATAVPLAKRANDRLAAAVAQHPDRFAAFANIPVNDPKAAADELERAVDKLGMKGAMVHGLTQEGLFFDDKRFWPIFERAEKLDVPLYIHPATPMKEVADAYYKDYLADFPGLLTAGWGFGVECATQAIRIVLSGVLKQYPGTRIILGHMGEGIPFSLWRINQALSRQGNKDTSFSFREFFSRHFWITTSGNFSNPALMCTVQEMGVDRILFSIDYPFVPNKPGVDWIPTIPLCEEDKIKILSGNARKLLKLK